MELIKELSVEEHIRSFISRCQDDCDEQELAGKLGRTRKTLWEEENNVVSGHPAYLPPPASIISTMSAFEQATRIAVSSWNHIEIQQ